MNNWFINEVFTQLDPVATASGSDSASRVERLMAS
jgi:hypothetical protein